MSSWYPWEYFSALNGNRRGVDLREWGWREWREGKLWYGCVVWEKNKLKNEKWGKRKSCCLWWTTSLWVAGQGGGPGGPTKHKDCCYYHCLQGRTRCHVLILKIPFVLTTRFRRKQAKINWKCLLCWLEMLEGNIHFAVVLGGVFLIVMFHCEPFVLQHQTSRKMHLLFTVAQLLRVKPTSF